ncbi:hypothetical protein CEJ45_20750 [Herbaspirillum aquaticum]|uniref:Restriction endonuclease n=1 Tax=Herbaspirillum aquaticum TaxID=568783 RepID=A0A225SNK2_9BURK|nr:hypothetical protein CEJ45_20750 [Herbaspirillum aquaticum]
MSSGGDLSKITVLEGQLYRDKEWLQRLGINSEEFKFLVNSKIFRAEESASYQLSFVGIVIFSNSLLLALPKFCDVQNISMQRILEILKVYFRRSQKRRPITDQRRDPEFGNEQILREYDAMYALRDWFFHHGIYRRDEAETGKSGKVHWAKTISKRIPLLSRSGVVYPEVIGERKVSTFNEISSLQIEILQYLLKRYDEDLPLQVSQAQQSQENYLLRDILHPNKRPFLLRRLALEKREVYQSEKVRLLDLLTQIVDSRLAESASQPQIYGTTAFYSVWEDVCRSVLCGTAPLDPESLLGEPVWKIPLERGEVKTYRMRQIPDMVLIRNSWRFIIDAKYYYRFPFSHPGAQDIVKQFYYLDSMQPTSDQIASIFLLPLPGAHKAQFLGIATIENGQRNFGSIEAWGLDPVMLLNHYVAQSPAGHNSLIDPILLARANMSEMRSQAPAFVSSQ